MGNRALLLLPFLVALLPGALAGAADREMPFPVDKTTILREEKVVYTVTGRVTIPRGVEVTCLRDVYVKGQGKGATIVVEGALKVHGVGAREVIFENVTIELAERFEDVQMDMAIFRKGSRVCTPEGVGASGKLFIELTDFKDDAKLDVTLSAGSVDLSSVCSDAVARVAAVDPEKARENKVKVKVRGCTQTSEHPGLVGGLVVEGAYDVTIRINRLGGPLSAFRNCRTLIFDGNKIDSKVLEFRQPGDMDFRRARFTKCDIYSGSVKVVSAKTDKKAQDPILMDRCWFRGETDPAKVMEKTIRDGRNDDDNVARVRLGKLGERPLELAGAWDR